MSKSGKKSDIHNRQAAFDFERAVDAFAAAKTEILAACAEAPSGASLSEAEAHLEIAQAVKRTLRKRRMSREALLDAINEYFGETRLSPHMLNHYLSKPTEYRMPAGLLFPLTRILGTEILQAIAEAEGARVISAENVRLMHLGRLERTIAEMQRLKRELKG